MVKVIASSLRKGNVVEQDGNLHVILTAENVHPGKGNSVTNVTMRRISDGTKVSERWRTTEQVERAHVDERAYDYLYEDGGDTCTTHPVSWEDYSFHSTRWWREQLRDISEPLSEKALRALEAGDISGLNALMSEMATGQTGVESLSLHVLARFCGELRDDLGEAEAKALLDRVADRLMESFAADWLGGRDDIAIGDLIAVAAARGVALPADTADRYVAEFAKMPPETMTSLYRDLSGGKPAARTELFHVVGRMVELGEQTGVPTPYHRAVLEKFAGQA